MVEETRRAGILVRYAVWVCAVVCMWGSLQHLQAQDGGGDYVVLRNDTRLEGRMHIAERPLKGLVLVVNGAEEYTLNNIYAFSTEGAYYTVHNHITMRGDVRSITPRLLQRQLEGAVDVFSEYKHGRSTRKYDFFKKSDAPIYPVNYKNLQDALSDNPASRALLDQSRAWNRASLAILLVGTGSIAYGVYRTFRDAPRQVPTSTPGITTGENVYKINVFIPVGVGISLSSLLTRKQRNARYRAALEVYNQ